MLILGVTGGIATGKSAVSGILAQLGTRTLNADDVARDLLAPDTDTTLQVLAAFPEVADSRDAQRQTIDRTALGRLIFVDPAARQILESLTHPAIAATLQAQSEAWRKQDSPPVGALEIPLLFEADLRHLVDRIVVVACGEETQIGRLQARRGIDRSEAMRQIASQWPMAQKITLADDVILTDCDLDDTRRQVLGLWQSYIDKERITRA